MPRAKKVASQDLSQDISTKEKKLRRGSLFTAIGRRKRARALVRLSPGASGIRINNLDWEKYFSERPLTAKRIFRPFETVSSGDKFSVEIKVEGGGKSAQIDAVSLGIARALVSFDDSLRSALRREGLLTRDPREKERKKPGFLRARKKPQFSKR